MTRNALNHAQLPEGLANQNPAADTAAFDEADCYSIEEFCRRHRLSVQAFYKHRDLMPPTISIGIRKLITKESAAAWRAKLVEEAEVLKQPGE